MTSRKEDGYNKLLPTRIRAIMDKRKMKQKDLADQTGIARQSIGYYADGSNIPNAEVLAKIAKALDVSSDYLIGLSDDEKPKTNTMPLVTCADAIRCLSILSTIKDTHAQVYESEYDGEGYSVPNVCFTFYHPGIVKYYTSINQVNQAIRNMPDSIQISAWKFQYDATQKLMEEAEKNKLEFTGFVQADEDEIGF